MDRLAHRFIRPEPSLSVNRRAAQIPLARRKRSNASAESIRNCDPSGSLSNLRPAVPVEVVAIQAA
jgi:hypothetical protein